MSKPSEENKLAPTNDPYVKPVVQKDMECLFGETLMLFSKCIHNGKEYKPFYGIGIVYRVVRGEKKDFVYVRFGCFQNVKVRLVVVDHNHARRQTLTLKRGQCCQIYGISRYYTDYINLNGKRVKGIKLGLFATAINGWYVPTMLDIKKMPTNEDVVRPTDKEENLMENFDALLDEFYNGDDE